MGIGAAGFVSSGCNIMASGTNLDWTGVRIGDVVAERVGLSVVVENDANAAGWAEARFGTRADTNFGMVDIRNISFYLVAIHS